MTSDRIQMTTTEEEPDQQMTDTSVNSQQKKNDLPVFTGEDTDNIMSFFDHFERLALCNEWSNEKIL